VRQAACRDAVQKSLNIDFPPQRKIRPRASGQRAANGEKFAHDPAITAGSRRQILPLRARNPRILQKIAAFHLTIRKSRANTVSAAFSMECPARAKKGRLARGASRPFAVRTLKGAHG